MSPVMSQEKAIIRLSQKNKESERHQVLWKTKDAIHRNCKSAHNEYVNNIISPDSASNSKRLYSYIDRKKNANHVVAPMKV